MSTRSSFSQKRKIDSDSQQSHCSALVDCTNAQRPKVTTHVQTKDASTQMLVSNQAWTYSCHEPIIYQYYDDRVAFPAVHTKDASTQMLASNQEWTYSRHTPIVCKLETVDQGSSQSHVDQLTSLKQHLPQIK